MTILCAYDSTPCWIMGTGFRIVTADCAIDEALRGPESGRV